MEFRIIKPHQDIIKYCKNTGAGMEIIDYKK